jgi:type II secretion system protein C
MATIGINDRPSLLRANGPKTISWALAVLISVELVRIGTALVRINPANTPQPPVATSPARVGPAGVDVAGIVSAHLFGIAQPEPAAQDPAKAPRSAASLVLSGTFATGDPRQGMAIIGDPGQFKVYSVGEQVDGALLQSVYFDHVILIRNGSLEALALPRPASGTFGRMPGSPRTAAAAAAAAPPAEEPAIIDTVAESGEETDGQGRFIGIRVTPGAERSTFIHSGLIGGDVIVAVNGTKLDSEHNTDIWKQISTGTTVTVLRRGRTEDVTVNFAP